MKQIFSKKNVRHLFWIIPLLSLAMHWRIFHTDLLGIHLWRQSQTQLNIQNFYRHDFNILNPRVNITNLGPNTIYRYEFPLMQWCIACVHKVLGESIMITRTCLFLLGLGSVWGMFFLGRTLFKDDVLAGLLAWAFNFSPLFYYYTMNPIPDDLALFGSIWGMGWFFKYQQTGRYRDAAYSAFFLLLSVWAKLPFILFYGTVGLYLFTMVAKTGVRYAGKYVRAGLIYFAFLLPAIAWYAWVIPGWSGNGILTGMLEHKIPLSESLNILKYHFRHLLPALLLNYGSVLFFLAGIFFLFKNKAYWKGDFWLLAVSGLAALAYFGFELNMINTVHDYYMMPFLLPVFMVAAYGIKYLWYGGKATQYLSILAFVLLPLIAFLTADNKWSVEKSYCNPALIENREELRNAVPRDEICAMQNDVSMHIYPYALDKIGPVFSKDELPPEWVEDMIRRLHIHYLYSDARKVDENPAIVPFLDTLLLERGTMRVYRFKTAEQLPPKQEK
ncbi:MAG TPA: glycosyltransferase family 39 protein [Saprospiraceae bacterium]|nr:glycosyltransferase family 39 protein [Saprospiraceae bacterium]HPI08777.1 glycosyltransferase family 39 protein [Saprospiraceae bacterium]